MDVLKELSRLKVETGSIACLGCGHENRCSTAGCAIIRAALKELKKQFPITPDNMEPFRNGKLGDCQRCGVRLESSSKYCYNCGQAINWEDDV